MFVRVDHKTVELTPPATLLDALLAAGAHPYAVAKVNGIPVPARLRGAFPLSDGDIIQTKT